MPTNNEFSRERYTLAMICRNNPESLTPGPISLDHCHPPLQPYAVTLELSFRRQPERASTKRVVKKQAAYQQDWKDSTCPAPKSTHHYFLPARHLVTAPPIREEWPRLPERQAPLLTACLHLISSILPNPRLPTAVRIESGGRWNQSTRFAAWRCERKEGFLPQQQTAYHWGISFSTY